MLGEEEGLMGKTKGGVRGTDRLWEMLMSMAVGWQLGLGGVWRRQM